MAAMKTNHKYFYQHSCPNLFVTNDKIELSVIIEDNENENAAVDTNDYFIGDYILNRIKRIYYAIYECFIRNFILPATFPICKPYNQKYNWRNSSKPALGFNPHIMLYPIDESVNESESCSSQACNDVIEWRPRYAKTYKVEPPIYAEPKFKVHGNNTIIVAPVTEGQRDTCTCSPCDCTRCLLHQVYAGPSVTPSHSTRDASTNMDKHPNCKCETCLDVYCVPDGTAACKCVSRHGVISKPVDKNPPDIGIHTLVKLNNNPLLNWREKLNSHNWLAARPMADTNIVSDCSTCDITPTPYTGMIPYGIREVSSTDSRDCKCSPCDCYLCSLRKQARVTELNIETKLTKRIQQSKVATVTNTLNSYCSCSPCECYYCQSKLTEEKSCRCDVCRCNDCGDMSKEAREVLYSTEKNESREYSITRPSEKPNEAKTVYTGQTKTVNEDLVTLNFPRSSQKYTLEKIVAPSKMLCRERDMSYHSNNKKIYDSMNNNNQIVKLDSCFKVGYVPTRKSFMSNSQDGSRDGRDRTCNRAKYGITRLKEPIFSKSLNKHKKYEAGEKNIAGLKYYYGQKVNISTDGIKEGKVKLTNLHVTDAEGINSVFQNPLQKHIINNECYTRPNTDNDLVVYFEKQYNFDNSLALKDAKEFSLELIRIIKKYLTVNTELQRVNEKVKQSHQLLSKLIKTFTRRQYMNKTSVIDKRTTKVTLVEKRPIQLCKKGTITFVEKAPNNK